MSLKLEWELVRLEETMEIKPFESADEELNDFLFNDAKKYLSSLLAVTYLIQTKDETIAYFCLANDRVMKDDDERTVWNKINRTIPNEKRRKSYPAVKIGRLAVSKNYAGLGFGNFMIDTVGEMYTNNQQQSGCRFITVDAYNNALGFYGKNDFKFLTDKDKTSETRAMYFDLKALS
jgi:predicted GNAT family N-acyltransferase